MSSFLNRHSMDQLRPAFLRTVIVYLLNVSPVTPWAVSSLCSSEFLRRQEQMQRVNDPN